ncbi:MAG: hypothetical protein F4Y49_08800 [Dehalococcoidia bacterium]|nr:hypothetical protein [Dehalococcoidia bacterium]
MDALWAAVEASFALQTTKTDGFGGFADPVQKLDFTQKGGIPHNKVAVVQDGGARKFHVMAWQQDYSLDEELWRGAV